jgi:D-glycero-beta-D-manno-heptose-7-phosphate kinase
MPPTIDRLRQVIARVRQAPPQVLVVGDAILDEYVLGRATRISREAPIPILEFMSRNYILGGAANPAANAAALGARVALACVVGDDTSAARLRDLLTQRQIDTSAVLVDEARPTTLKTRWMAHTGLHFAQQLARMDTLTRAPLSGSIAQQATAAVQQAAAHADLVLLSDYGGGMLNETVIAAAVNAGRLVVVDGQGQFEQYRAVTLLKCNADDALGYLRREVGGWGSAALATDADFAHAAQTLCARLALRGAMVITRGADGATLATADGQIAHCPSPSISDVYDTVGAGDTAIAVMGLALAVGASFEQAVTLANYASGIVVRKVGNYTPSIEELLAALDQD